MRPYALPRSLLRRTLILCMAAAGCSDDAATGGGGASASGGASANGGTSPVGGGGAGSGGATTSIGGGGSSSTGIGAFQILFPPAASLTDASTLSVHGTAETGTQSVTVLGVPAIGGPSIEDWLADVPLVEGAQSVTVTMVDPDGVVVTPAATLQVERNAMPAGAQRLDLDLVNNRAFVANFGSIYEFDLATGQRRFVSGYSGSTQVGQGPAFSVQIVGLAWDAANDRLLVADWDQLLSVDVATGDRTVVSDGSLGTFPSPPRGDIVLDGDRVFLGDTGHIFAIDLATGVGTTISSSSIGTGPSFGTVAGLVLDAPDDRLYALDGTSIIRVDLTSGDRTTISGPSLGTGPFFANISSLGGDPSTGRLFAAVGGASGFDVGVVDIATGNRTDVPYVATGPHRIIPRGVRWDGTKVLVTDELVNGVVSVDVDNGDRAIVSAPVIGAGEHLVYPALLAYDATSDRFFVATSNTTPIAASLPLVAIDAKTGARTIVSDFTLGTGPYVTAYDIEAHGGKVYAAGIGPTNQPVIVTIDPTSGDRTLLSADGDGQGPDFGEFPDDVAFDPGGSEVFALVTRNDQTSSVFSVDPVTGARAVVSSTMVGSGPPLQNACDLTHDGANLLAVQPEVVLAIDPTSGNRTIVSGPGVGTGPALGGCTFSADADTYLAPDGTLYVLQQSRIVAVDLASGDRREVSGSVGSGPHYVWAGLDGDASGRLFVTDRAFGVVAVDTRTGARAALSR